MIDGDDPAEAAFREFRVEVETGAYLAGAHVVAIVDKEFEAFLAEVER